MKIIPKNSDTTIRYPASVKETAIRKYLSADTSYAELAREVGACPKTVRTWVRDAGGTSKPDRGFMVARRVDDRTADQKLHLLLRAATLADADRGAFLRKEGLRDGDLERWRAEAENGLAGDSVRMPQSRRIRQLEAENRKQAKRLRQAEALLVLQKKVQALWEVEDESTP